MNEKVERLEHDLTKYIFKRRMIEFICLFGSIIIFVLCFVIRDLTKEVIINGDGYFKYETIVYNDYYIIGVMIGLFGSMFAGSFLLTDVLCSRFATTKVNGYYITVYKGMVNNVVYIDGEENARLTLTRYCNVIDTKLPNGVKVSISFSRVVFSIAHLSFSDNTSPIDL